MSTLPARFRLVPLTENGSHLNAPGRGVRGRITIFVLVALILALGTTNVLTLVDNDFHTKAYRFVEAIGQVTSTTALLENSPTEMRKREVAVAARQQKAATMALVAQSLILVDATNALVGKHKSLQQSHRALAGASSSISRRLAIRTAKGATRSVTSLAGKTIPYFGVASIVALTAYDVADACETLKDLNALAVAAGDEKGSEEATVCSIRVPSVDQLKTWVTGG